MNTTVMHDANVMNSNNKWRDLGCCNVHPIGTPIVIIAARAEIVKRTCITAFVTALNFQIRRLVGTIAMSFQICSDVRGVDRDLQICTRPPFADRQVVVAGLLRTRAGTKSATGLQVMRRFD